jgi:hypothetical protein
MKKNGQVINNIVLLVIALIVIALLAFLAYKYILGTGEQVGGLSKCSAQAVGSKCVASTSECTDGNIMRIGCPETAADKTANKNFCCVPKGTSAG